MTSKPSFASTLSAFLLCLFVLGAAEARAQAGPIGSSVQILAGGPRWPAVAYDQVNHVYLVVVGSGGVIKGRFVAEDGSASGSTFNISSGEYAQTPRVAYGPGAGGFLVTWHGWDRIPDHGWAVRARKVTYPGGAVGAPSVLSSTNTLGEMGPSVEYAAGAGRFLVTWVSNWNIGARLVDGNGAPVGGQIAISGATAESDRDPAVGYFPETNRFFVVWSAYNDAGHYSTARGRLIDASSGTGVGAAVRLGQSSVIYVPEVALNASTGRMFLTWMQGYSGGFRPFGTHVDSSGNPAASPALLSSTVGTYDANSVAYNVRTNTYYLVTQPPGQVLRQDFGFEISGAGVPLATAAAVTSIPDVDGFSGAFHPRLAPSTQEGRWLVGTVGSFTSVWTQLIGRNGTQPPPTPPPAAGGGGTYSVTISPAPAHGTVSGGGLLCGSAGSTCRVTRSSATALTLSAVADSGYSFSGWSGACSGTNPTTNVSVNGVKTCTATFTATAGGTAYRLSISPAPAYGTVSGGGINCGTGGSACQTNYGNPTVVALSATSASGYSFAGWGGACAGATAATTVQVNAIKTCSATFAATGANTLTITPPAGGKVQGAGLNCGAGGTRCSVTMPAPMTLGITATASTGYAFGGWTGSCSGTAASVTVKLNGPRTCGASFTSNATPTNAQGAVNGPPYTLTITPPVGGRIQGAGLNCGTGGTLCSVTMPAPMTIGISATASSGYTLTGWIGACSGTASSVWVPLNGSRTCGATFTRPGDPPTGPPYTLTITPSPGGKVQGAGLSCGAGGTLCSVTMPAPMTIGISATASTGYTFSGWAGDCSGTASGVWVALRGPRACTASFTPAGGGSLP